MIRSSNAVSQIASEVDRIQLPNSMRIFLDTFKQSLLALLFITGTLSAGLLFVSYIFVQASWVIILYPSILSMRGVIGGLYSGRLSTGLHIGTINPKIFGNTKYNPKKPVFTLRKLANLLFLLWSKRLDLKKLR